MNSDTNEKVYKASKKSIEKAIELLKSTNTEEKYKCVNIRGKSACLPNLQEIDSMKRYKIFFKDLYMYRLQNCLAVNDWDSLLRLFQLILSGDYARREQFIWKYAILIMLYCPGRTAEDIDEFMKICIGCRNETEVQHALKEILTFPSTEDEKISKDVQESRQILRAMRRCRK